MKLFFMLLLVMLGLFPGNLGEQWFPVKQKMSWSGYWGSWGNTELCPNTYATKFKVRVERSQGIGDDTALNSICLVCKGGSTRCSRSGYWGSWYYSSTCSSGFSGAKFRIERRQGRGDDTAGNTLYMNCGTGTNYYGAHGAPNMWGDWSSRTCPHGTRVCGIRTRVEPRDGDDTALNGVEFTCCSTIKRVDVYLHTIFAGAGGSGSSSYVKITKTVEVGMSTTTQQDFRQATTIATHAGVVANYDAVTADASLDVTSLRESFRSTINTRTYKHSETREFHIHLDKPTYIYQARSTIVMTDGSQIKQGSSHVIQKNKPIKKRHFTIYGH